MTDKHSSQLSTFTQSGDGAHSSKAIDTAYDELLGCLPYPALRLNSEQQVLYINPAFMRVFGWTLRELNQTSDDFIPGDLREEAQQFHRQLYRKKKLHGVETRRLAKDGRILDVMVEGSMLPRKGEQPDEYVLTLRDITHEKRLDHTNQVLFRISKKLHHVQGLDDLLEFITKEVQSLLHVGGAMVLLVDDATREFFFRVATLDNAESGQRMKEVRFPLDKGVAGYVYRTGQSHIVTDTSQSPYFLKQVDEESGYQTDNMLDVPLEVQDRRIGVLCAVNKRIGPFDQDDVDLLTTIASTIALPIENARIHDQLKRSYDDVKSLNRAKDRVIHHLSHELKTPLSVVSASLQLLRKRLTESEEQGYHRILDRAQRNLQRILDMQYEIEDILRERHYTTYHLLSILLDACVDELDVLVTDELGEWSVMQRLRRRVEELFGPRESISRKIKLDGFVRRQLDRLYPNFAHRTCELVTHLKPVSPIWIPPDVLAKVVEGLLRNAVENTPDGSRIEIAVKEAEAGPQLEIHDYGIGMTQESQHVIVENYFPRYDVMRYTSRTPFEFNAGGKGFDLLRMRVFSERYHFQLQLTSQRCIYIPREEDECPGDIELCQFCTHQNDCLHSGGTLVTLQFSRAEET